MEVNSADIQVFEYESQTDAREEMELVSPEGISIGTTMVSWVSTPHFYNAGWLIVLYVGEDESIVTALEGVLGQQFAGVY